MLKQISVRTQSRNQMIDITGQVRSVVRDMGIRDGTCCVFVPHTTAAVTINENADPDVPRDILSHLSKLVPERAGYLHGEGNSDAHIKASLFGPSQVVFIENGALVLGTWQSLFFCEFDGPRTRQILVKAVPDGGKP